MLINMDLLGKELHANGRESFQCTRQDGLICALHRIYLIMNQEPRVDRLNKRKDGIIEPPTLGTRKVPKTLHFRPWCPGQCREPN